MAMKNNSTVAKKLTAWYKSLDVTHVDQVDTQKIKYRSWGVWNVLLYWLLDVATWVKCLCHLVFPTAVYYCSIYPSDPAALLWHYIDSHKGLDTVD